jgi:DNA-binding transcriptional MerR regulator
MEAVGLTIAGVAQDAGVGVETVRYYERRGLIEQPERCNGAYRRYGLEHVKRIRFVRRAQELGFTLEEIGALLELQGRGTETRLNNSRSRGGESRRNDLTPAQRSAAGTALVG